MSEYNDYERRGTEGWHLRKELNISHILTTIALTVGLFTWGAKMDSRVSTLEEIIKRQDSLIETIDSHINMRMTNMQKDVREIRDVVVSEKRK